MLTAVRYAVRLMVPGDIPQVTDIERESFASLWPQTTYKRELRNRLARYRSSSSNRRNRRRLPPCQRGPLGAGASPCAASSAPRPRLDRLRS